MSDGQADFAKGSGLLPAIVQHARTGEVLMLGYMDEAALAATREDGRVTFFSRSKGRLWTKGETSGNTLMTVDVRLDCDADTILVRALPAGPTCHNGTSSCFGDDVAPKLGFLAELDALVAERHAQRPQGSYTTTLFDGGMRRIAQKVGEEGVETALAVVAEDDDALVGEAADLVFHLMVALRARGIGFDAVAAKLASRHATARMTSP
ncbi:bifunctional phosphoribosyl-AMP cyclohydrolase/phosphoribosyl-ATP diphosphatase HisIE [Luteibacter flocculans]|uniref:Histidine biosynthesis bifunctional protein HisIE n=1 Tax=Luteibacter flocculans TaxID=2780091 RepID=A0ABY4T4D8_9GAMM|nr:bifunctional phosphoribosyl-AMP cyclohydrolase/phosphoribosyl-ATP diphosphatase HisIE [Luteibacter flocculans]URL59555.1 bifunctional phosphoribosyl-AMP cyclohydrolase/phosphoribosyl-ATP diphosphatase HisIE [Luteibacter flocculans]